MKETILGQLGARLAREDLAGTADWVSRMEHDKGSQRITDNLLMQWVSKDAAAASEWVEIGRFAEAFLCDETTYRSLVFD